MKRWTIYCHTHVDSGRRYIGLTGQTMLARWKNHINAAKSSKNGRWHFPNAIRKYGKDAFSHEIIRIFDSLEDANLAEKCLIKRWKTRDSRFGFNLSPGGKHVPHLINNPWKRPEFRAKALYNLAKLNASLTPQQRSTNSKIPWQQSEYRAKKSLQSKKQWQNPEIREKNLAASKAGLNTPESKSKRSLSAKKQWLDPIARTNGINATRAKWKDGEIREKLKNKWLDPDFRKKCSVGPQNYRVALSTVAAEKTHCKNGHELTTDSIYIIEGLRVCATCESIRHKNKTKIAQSLKTHCLKGHEFTVENTLFDWHGAKKCVICVSTCRNGHLKLGNNVYTDGKYKKCLICVRNTWKRKSQRTA